MIYVARPYQGKAAEDIVNYVKNNYTGPGVAVLPTAAGKSWIIADVIKRLGDIPTLVLQPSKELLTQNHKKYCNLDGEASLYSASVGSKEVGNVTYATPGSIKNCPSKFSHVKLVIIDECHIGTTRRKERGLIKESMVTNMIKTLGDVKVVGLTATPLILKNYMGPEGTYSQLNILTRVRPKFWSKIIHVTQVKELYANNYLTPLRFTTFDLGLRKAKMRGSDFDLEQVAQIGKQKEAVPFVIKLIKESIKRGKKKILVFTSTVEESYEIQKSIDSLEVVSSSTKKKDRESIVERFVEKDLICISNYGTLTTGFDAPDIDLIVCMRPTQSYALWYQLIGRGIRIAENKKVCDVVDLSGNYQEFGDPKDLVIREMEEISGWGLFVKDFLISGIPIGQKIHIKDLDYANMEIKFGQKYKGKKFSEVPTSYLKWVADNFDFSTEWSKKNVKKPLKKLGIL